MSCRDETGECYSRPSLLPLEASLPAGSMYLTVLSTRKEEGLHPCGAQHCLHPGRRGHRPDLAFSLNPPGLLQPVLTGTRCSPAAQLGGTLSRARTQARQRSAMYRTLAAPTGETRGRHPALCSQLVNGAPRGLSQAWCRVLGESINQ